MRLPILLDRLDAPPLSLPRGLDGVSDRFWRLGPRHRTALVVLVVAALLVVATHASTGSPWGPPVEVPVAARALPAGHELEAGDLRTEHWPADLVPEDPAPLEAEGTATGLIPAGTPLSQAHLGEPGLGALVAEGRAAVAVPVDQLAERTVGARLTLVAGNPQRASPQGIPARVLATDAEHVWVEVEQAEAPAVAAAAHARSLTAVVRPHRRGTADAD